MTIRISTLMAILAVLFLGAAGLVRAQETKPGTGPGLSFGFGSSSAAAVNATNLKKLGVALAIYAAEYNDSLPLTMEEASALANLLGAPQLVAQLTDEHQDLPGIHTRQIPVGSPFDGRTLGDTAMRTRTGASVVAVMRAGQVHPSPTPDFILANGDLMVTVGTTEGLDNAVKILKRG